MNTRSTEGTGRGEDVVLVPVWGLVDAISALTVARKVAEIEDATLHVAFITDPSLPGPDFAPDHGPTREDLHGAVLDYLTGSPVESILHLAKGWDRVLVVVAMDVSAEAPEEGRLNPEVERFLCETECPLLFVPPGRGARPWEMRRLLVPHDGTPTTTRVMGMTTELAQRTGAEIYVLHVAEPGAGRPQEPGSFTTPRYVDQPQYEWPEWAKEFAERFCVECGELGTEGAHILLASGDPGEEILRYATDEEADLIVLGWHGTLEGDRATTLKSVLRHAPCPVLVLRVGTA